MNEPIRTGILGAGGMGTRFARCIGQIEDCEVVAVCSRTLEKAAELSRSECGGVATGHDDFDAMLERELDALFVCLPPHAHTGQVEAAAERGVHLFLEKPIALEVARAESMVAAAEGAGVVTQVGHHMRFLPAVRRVAAMIEAGTSGRPLQFIASYFCNSLHSAWWRDVTKSGGQLLEQMIHMYDMSNMLLGRAASVCAVRESLTHQPYRDYTVEDTSAAIVRYDSGAVASITGTNNGVPGRWAGEATLVCERATIRNLTGAEATIILHYGPDTPDSVVEEVVSNDVDPYLEETQHFFETIRGRLEPAVPIRVGLDDLRLVTQAIRSASSGEWEEIAASPERPGRSAP